MSWVFKALVDFVGLGLHDYHQIIKRPMELGTVMSNLSKGSYSNVGDFAADVKLVLRMLCCIILVLMLFMRVVNVKDMVNDVVNMINSASAVEAPSVLADIDDVPMSVKMDGVKKSKKNVWENVSWGQYLQSPFFKIMFLKPTVQHRVKAV
ncbi:bromodomain, NET domain protein [Artemisia annua]|uniref:Bromodomain, NET domain protein n=1 Tax=Artemisia annua TaxID=35608 RepID=A0A2U1NZB2_ARTAN|nr:bromodomain, NET domain protein [Artemisia annua]